MGFRKGVHMAIGAHILGGWFDAETVLVGAGMCERGVFFAPSRQRGRWPAMACSGRRVHRRAAGRGQRDSLDAAFVRVATECR